MKTYQTIQLIPHTTDYVKCQNRIKQAQVGFFKSAGFVALVSIISENELIGFSFFEVNVVLGVIGGLFALKHGVDWFRQQDNWCFVRDKDYQGSSSFVNHKSSERLDFELATSGIDPYSSTYFPNR